MSCIDFIFCTNQSVISNHGVDVSIFDTCHHNIIYSKINILVALPPTYVREVCDYEKANIEHIKKAISNFDWNKAFENLSVDEKVDFLNKTLLNIFRITFQTKKLNGTIGNPHNDRHLKKIFKRKMLADKIFLQKWSEKS